MLTSCRLKHNSKPQFETTGRCCEITITRFWKCDCYNI